MENSTNGSMANKKAEQKQIEVTLRKNEKGSEVLHFDGAQEELDINFSDSDQSSLRRLFCWLLDRQLRERASLKLTIDSSVKNGTYIKIAEDYIGDLNKEIDALFITEEETIKKLSGEITGLSDGDDCAKDD